MMANDDVAGGATILSVGTSNPPARYTQDEVLQLFRIENRRIKSIFQNSHIGGRYLDLPTDEAQRTVVQESALQLWEKHRRGAIKMGREAILSALAEADLSVADVDYLVCVTSTGFLCPSLTAYLIAELGFRRNIHRVDVVGMGCNAGLNALQPLSSFCALREARVGVQLCVEVCSAAYVFDDTLRTSVVNCLFGDGAAAAVVSGRRREQGDVHRPRLLAFASHIITEALDAMRFDFDGHKNSFFLARDIPYVIGEHARVPLESVLAECGLKQRDIAHWVIHSGGKKVIDSIKYSLGISDHDLRHTKSVLHDFGNVSSGSFLFSLQRLLREGVAEQGDYIVFMTMGPGSSIECCLGRF